MKTSHPKIIAAGHLIDKNTHKPVRLDDIQTEELDINSSIALDTSFQSSSVCPYIQTNCLLAKIAKHCNNDYTQCQTYKYYERWGK